MVQLGGAETPLEMAKPQSKERFITHILGVDKNLSLSVSHKSQAGWR